MVLCSFLVLAGPTDPVTEATLVDPEVPLKAELESDGFHDFLLDLEAGQYLHLIVDQHGIDVVVTLHDPAGTLITEVDSPTEGHGAEEVHAIITTSGRHRLQVRSLEADAAPGRYQLRIETLREAETKDRALVEAVSTHRQGFLLRLKRTASGVQQAIELYKQALPLWRQAGDTRGEAGTLCELGYSHRLLGNLEGAAARYEEALELWRQTGGTSDEILTLIQLGRVHFRMNQPQVAMEHYRAGLALAREAGNRTTQAELLNNMGVVHQRLGEPDHALPLLEEAAGLHHELGSSLREAQTLCSLSAVRRMLGELHQAVEHGLAAVDLAEQLGDSRCLAVAFNNLGTAYDALGQYQRALFFFNKALALNRELKQRREQGRTLNNIGWAHHHSGDLKLALEAFDQALELLRAAGDAEAEVGTLNNRCRTLAALGERQQAQECYQNALEMRAGDRRGLALTLADTAQLSLQLAQTELAAEQVARALQLSRQVHDPATEALCLRIRAAVLARQGKLQLALGELNRAIEMVESLRLASAGFSHRASFLASKRRYYEQLVGVLMALDREHPGSGYAARALQASERARARSFIDMLDGARIEPLAEVSSELLEDQAALSRRLNALELQRWRKAEEADAASGRESIAQQIEAAMAEYEAAHSRILAASPRYAELTSHRPLEPAAMQALLDDETVLLEYSLGPDSSFLWLVTSSGLAAFELPPRQVLEERARRLYELLTAREEWPEGELLTARQARIADADAELGRVSAELGNVLLGPVLPQLAGKRLVIVTDGALEYLPFAALMVPVRSGKLQPLVVGHEIIRLASISVLAALRRQRRLEPAPATRLLVAADPIFSTSDPRLKRDRDEPPGSAADARPGGEEEAAALRGLDSGQLEGGRLQRLRYSRREALAIAGLVEPVMVTLALDQDASRELITSGRFERHRFIHFATHGLVNSRHPELSALALSMVDEQGQPVDGFLRLHEIYNLRLDADLVVLSACRTALGREIHGEGLVGLTRGFMYAGARRVLASLWIVQDRATAELMTHMYSAMFEDGASPAAALRSAQLALLRNERFGAPYYWAAFVLQGDWQ